MPKRKTHEKVAKLLLGQSYGNVDAIIDLPVKFMGQSHRKLFHTVPEGFVIGLVLTGEVAGGLAGVAHVVVDALDSCAKREIDELIANRGDGNCRKKRKTKKRKNQ